jgi:hypothetical protein
MALVRTLADGDCPKAHFGGKLNGQMPQPADAQDGHGVPSAHAAVASRVERRDAGAHQRTGVYGIDLFRDQRQALERHQHVIPAIHRDARDSLIRTRDKDPAAA